MSKAQREKGKAGERELAALFREYGFNARRTSQYCGQTGDASDVIGLPGIHVECKRCETTKIHEWMAQAKRDAKPELIPAVLFIDIILKNLLIIEKIALGTQGLFMI